MTILSVAYPLAAVSEDAVGGAEQVLSMLDRAIVDAGHNSIVIAAAGSRVRGTLISLPPIPNVIDDEVRARVRDAIREAITATLASQRIDVVHLHGVDFPDYLPAPGVPVLITLHLPLHWYPKEALNPTRPLTYLRCVSQSQANSVSARQSFLPPIPNGVDLTRFQLRKHKQNFALLLGRICPEKGAHLALEACKTAGIPLLIGGQVYPYPAHEHYFQNEVAPLLDQCRRFLGPLAISRKTALLAAARCLLIPSLAAETSSLVAMEAMASGTPVIAFRNGALSEIVEDGRTGFLVDDEHQMAAAIRRVEQIDPAACRKAAETRFSQEQTIGNYFTAYERIQRNFAAPCDEKTSES